jgi:uncharacterized protein YutE (UPF0331/DUF86 family)
MQHNAELLKRMKLTIPGFRPAVINEELYIILNEFRGFRHIFRHSYAFELNCNKEREVAKKLDLTTKMFTQQVQNFLTHLDQL